MALFRGRILGGWIYVGLFILSAIWGFARIARRRVGDGAVADRAAGLADRRFARDADTDRGAQPVEVRRRRDRAGVLFVAASFALRHDRAWSPRRFRRRGAWNDRPVRSGTGADWPAYGGTDAARRYSPLTQITPDNVGKLSKVWEVHTGGMPTNADYQKLYGTEKRRSRSAICSTPAPPRT